MDFLEGVDILQLSESDAAVATRCVDFAGQMARQLGATVITSEHFAEDKTFAGRGKQRKAQPSIDEAITWAGASDQRLLLIATDADYARFEGVAAVLVSFEHNASEATLFADSGIADLLGDPSRAPIIPTGSFGAGTAAYGVLAAITALTTRMKRYGVKDVASVDAAGVLAWVNWKAALTGELGRDISRQGDKAEWPVVPCKDGHVALVYQERDWRPLIEMIGDERLEDERFSSFKQRAQYRDDYMSIIRDWSETKSKRELVQLFLDYEIPAAPVMDESDLLTDPLLVHRDAFVEVDRGETQAKSPVLAHRVIDTQAHAKPTQGKHTDLPLAGIRVLDLGIITAGAGVSAMLADLGAEVLKIESQTYPDPFRAWAGDAVSPFFKGNNRNKYGLALDLKTDAGRAAFTELVATADVVLENFRRGVLDRLGFDYNTLKQINPGIVLASISGQGLSGPGASATSFGSTLEASSGFSVNARYADSEPYITGRNLNYPDQTVVLYAAAVLTAALADRSHGMHIDVSQRDVAVFISGETIEQVSMGGEVIRQDNGACFATADAKWIAVAAPDNSIDGQPIGQWIAATTADDVLSRLNSDGVSAALVLKGSDMYERFKDSYQFQRSPNGDLVKGFPFQMQGMPMRVMLDSPGVGEHTNQFVSTS